MKLKNLIGKSILIISLLVFSFTPSTTILAENDYQLISLWDSKKIIKSFSKEIYNDWENRKANADNNLNTTTLSLLKDILRSDFNEYAIHDLPIEISINLISQSLEISKIINGDVSEIIKKIEKDSVNFAVSYLNDYFNKSKMKVSYGAINVDYKTLYGDNNAIIQYIIVYDEKSNKLIARIYSPNSIIPPDSYGGYGLGTSFYNDLRPGEKISPFIVEISGDAYKSSLGEYGWDYHPQIDLFFSNNVPDLGLRPPSLVEKYVIDPIKNKIKEITNIFSFVGVNTELAEVISTERGDTDMIDKEISSMTKEDKIISVTCSKNSNKKPLQEIIINEVAWMGSKNSHNDEWIELKNISNKDINMKGWSLVDNGEQINITFNDLIIKSGQIALLERTDDNKVPFIKADLIYSGALANNSEELYLFNNNCELEDYVSAMPSWPAGDNVERKTMERNGDFSWHTYSENGYMNIWGTPKEENSERIIEDREKKEVAIEEKKEKDEEKKEDVKEKEKDEEKKEDVKEKDEENKEEEISKMIVNYCSQVGTPSHSNVIINEVAWMGTTVGSNKEWIELKNVSTSTIYLDGWQLLDKDNQIKIVFEESDIILPGHFYLLERTNDDSVSNISADKIYVGTLSNSNESLRLFDSSCNLIDEVVASPTWPAGSSSERKTMERKSDLSWQTSFIADGTPKLLNSQPIISYVPVSSGGGGGSNTSVNQVEEINYCSQVGTPSHSNVIINEVAWMGTTVGSNKEWIEIKNTSEEEINMNGWQLLSKENKIKIVFEESDIILPGQFFLLERTSDDSVIDIVADKTYTGAIGNSDDFLRLFDSSCNLIDEVVASPDWIAGDNDNKKTMERKSDLSWQTSSIIGGTPKIENSTQDEIINEEEDEDEEIINDSHLIISEIQIGDVEYVELYNQSQEEINLCVDEECFYLSYFPPTFDIEGIPKYNWHNPYYNWKLDGTIEPEQYYLIVIYGDIEGDIIATTNEGLPYSSAIINNSEGSFALFSSNPINNEEITEEEKIEQTKLLKIDAVGWGNNNLPVKEKEVTLVGEESIGRKWLDGKYIDTDDNFNDFQLQKPSPGEYSKQPPEKIDDILVEGNKNTVTLSWEAPDDPDSPVEEINYQIYASLDGDNFELLDNFEIERDENQNIALIEYLYYEKDYYFTIKAIDIDDNESEISDEVHFKTFSSNHIKPLLYGNYQKSNVFQVPNVTGEWSVESLETIIEEPYYTTSFASNPLIGDGEIVYLSAYSEGARKIIAIKNNEIVWSYAYGSNADLIFLGKDGTIYASDGNSIFALSPDGKLKWRQSFDRVIGSLIAVDSQEKIYFISNGILYYLEDKGGEASYNLIYEFDNFEMSAPLVLDSNNNVYFSNGDTLFKAKYDLGLIGQKTIETIYDYDYPGERDKKTSIEQIKLTDDNRILLKVRNHYYDKDGRENMMNSLLPSIDEEIIWTKKSYSGIEAVIDDQFLTWHNTHYSLYGISIDTGEILWSKKWFNYDFFYLIADYNRNVYLIRSSSLEGYNVDSITNNDPQNGLILKVIIGARAPFFSIGQSRIYFSCYDKIKSLTY